MKNKNDIVQLLILSSDYIVRISIGSILNQSSITILMRTVHEMSF
jgi:hypothetical protein